MSKYAWAKTGVVKVMETEGNSAMILLPGKKKTIRVSKTQLSALPRSIRLAKKSEFDQKCGCTSVVDIRGKEVEAYNVYGKLDAYNASNVREGLNDTPHARRKHLHEKGFVRARGIHSTAKDVGAKMFSFFRKGYKVSEMTTRKSKPAKKVAAPAATPAAPVAANA